MVVRAHGLGVAAAFVVAALAGCTSGSSGDSAPAIGSIPSQVTPGGMALSLDLSTYVSDSDGDPLTFTVTSGGGSFSGSTYSHMFDTLGSYTVGFAVSDGKKTRSGSFDVTVNTANLAVVTSGDDLELLDTDTHAFLPLTATGGVTEQLVATLPTGEVIYRRTVATSRLFVFDPSTRQSHVLGDSIDYDTVYAGKTSAGDVVFTRAAAATPTDTDLYLWRRETGTIKQISAVAGSPDGNAMVSSGDLVFYQRGTPSDVYVYDPATDQSTAVANGSTAEVLRGTVADGSVVLSRIGGGGEQDLFHYDPNAGLVEIGADLSSTVQAQSKTFAGSTSDGKVVFEAAGASTDLYVWSPSTGTTRTIANSSVDETLAAVTPIDEIVYTVATTSTDDDLYVYTWSDDTSRLISPADSVSDSYQGATSVGDVVFVRATATGDDLWYYDTSASTAHPVAETGPDDYSLDAILENDRVVFTRSGSSGGVFVVTLAPAPTATAVGGAGATFAGETSGGDFVVQTVVSAQTDLVLWDESATAVVTISDTTGDDTFGAGTSTGGVLFSRITSGKTTSDLFLWDPVAGETQLTDSSEDHGVSAVYAADNS